MGFPCTNDDLTQSLARAMDLMEVQARGYLRQAERAVEGHVYLERLADKNHQAGRRRSADEDGRDADGRLLLAARAAEARADAVETPNERSG